MCGTVIEILFLIAGTWLIFSGKVPEKLFRVLFGKGRYVMTSTKARIFGLVLASPLPVVLIATFLSTLFFGEDAIESLMLLETAYLFIIMLIAVIVARRIKQPEVVQKEVIEIEN